MKNVDERKRASGDLLWCPYSGGDDDSAANCTTILCAHYNPDARECVHVEAARAQVRIADVLEAIEMLPAETLCPADVDAALARAVKRELLDDYRAQETESQTKVLPMQPQQQTAEWIEMARELECEVRSLTSKAARVIAARPEVFHEDETGELIVYALWKYGGMTL
jgi:hypothetical protein